MGIFSIDESFSGEWMSCNFNFTDQSLVCPDVVQMPTRVNTQRIAKNTLLLYGRMLLIMAVSLYTSRDVLNTLGVEDYGIYNVVGGILPMLAFLNGPMVTSTQRDLTTEQEKGNRESLKVNLTADQRI